MCVCVRERMRACVRAHVCVVLLVDGLLLLLLLFLFLLLE